MTKGASCSKRFMDDYFAPALEMYTDQEIADRFCMSVKHVKNLKKGLKLRDSMKDIKVMATVEVDSNLGKIKTKEEKTIDFDTVRPTSFAHIARIKDPEKQRKLVEKAAKEGLTTREVQKEIAKVKGVALPVIYHCHLCGSKIAKKTYDKIAKTACSKGASQPGC